MAEPRAIGGSDETQRREDVEVLKEVSALTKPEGQDWDALLLFSVNNTSSAVGCDTSIPLTEKDKFAVACSKKLMRSWVSQPSPCCAAASVGKRRLS